MAICLIKPVPGKPDENIDKWGAVVIIVGILVLMFGLNEVGSGQSSWLAWFIFVVGLFILLSYRWVEKKQKYPIVDPQIIRTPSFLKIIFVQSINQYIFFSAIFLLSLYYQNILGYTSLIAGFILGVLTISFAVCSPLVGFLIKRIAPKIIVITGTCLLLISTILFGIKMANPSVINLLAPLVVLGLGMACIQCTNMVVAITSFPLEKSGIVSSLFISFCILGGSIGTTVTSLNLSSVSSSKLNAALKAKGISLSSAKELLLEKAAEGSAALDKLPFSSSLKMMAKDSFFKAYHVVLWVFFFLAAAAIVMSFFYRREEKTGMDSP